MPSEPETDPAGEAPAEGVDVHDPNLIREFQAAVKRGNESADAAQQNTVRKRLVKRRQDADRANQ
ncbi:MAG TPA: hypothetical protein VG796_07005 [Verrucomicrobiales bacterium]|nr:hypothetical protein [Verrucomicrobiales bacterium]